MLKLEHPRGYTNSQMNIISNSPFTQEEFVSWQSMIDYPPSRHDLEALRQNAEKVKEEFRYTPATLQRMQREHEDRMLDVSQVGNITQEKIRVNRSLDIARRLEDEEREERMKTRLIQLEDEQRRRYRKELRRSRININQINASLRRLNDGKDKWLKKSTFEKMKTDQTNRKIVYPSIEKFGKSAEAELKRHQEFAERIKRKQKKKTPMKKKKVHRKRKLSISLKPKVTGSEEDVKDVLPKDALWKRLTEVCKSVNFPQDAEPSFKKPDTWLGTMNYYPTTFAKESLERPKNVTIYSLESYLSNFKQTQ